MFSCIVTGDFRENNDMIQQKGGSDPESEPSDRPYGGPQMPMFLWDLGYVQDAAA